jgi:2-polyprenyl-3-methyl-5-hydroxy-6-metoxy-1,4-benzoquinol methylase
VNADLPVRRFRPGLHRFKVLAKHLPKAAEGATWLDLGGGAGEFAVIASERGYSVTLVDGDPRNVANAANLGIRGLAGDLDEPLTDLQDATFDGVSLIEVVEHVPRAEQLMSEARRVLKPGALLLLSTPNAVWWHERLRILVGRQPEAEGYHYRFFSVDGVRRLCTKAGFQIAGMWFSSPAFGLNLLLRLTLGPTHRRHVAIPALFAGSLAQTVYVVARKP